MTVIDSHVHFWDPAVFAYDWLDALPAINRPFGPAEYTESSREATVERLIFVQADCRAEEGLGEIDWVIGQGDPRLAGLVAFAPVDDPMALRPWLEELARRPLVKGVRRLIQGEAPGFCGRPEFREGMGLLAEAGFTFDLCLKHHQLAEAVDLVRATPEGNFILDHVGKPDIAAGQLDPWRRDLEELARLPNVLGCKISGMATEADWLTWTPGNLRPFCDHALHCFGVERLMFGGDWPVVNLAGGFGQWFRATLAFTEGWTVEDQAKFYQGNARRIYRV